MGDYVICDKRPAVVSALGAIPKPGSDKIRLIHDLSRGGVNALALETSVKYPSVDEAVALMPPDAFIAKLDLAAAYRSVPIHMSSRNLTGLQWIFKGDTFTTFLQDTKLPFGAAKSCSIFQRLTDSVVRMMNKRGFTTVGYLDDYLIIGDSFASCQLGYSTLAQLLQDLGFTLNWEKAVPPCQSLTYLGVEIDTKSRRLALPANKLNELRELVDMWCSKRRATKIALQSLVGKLNWAARVIRGGRCFLRRLIDLASSVKFSNWHVGLNAAARADISWWRMGLSIFHGKAAFPVDLPMPSYQFDTDSCLTGGAGHFGDDWFYVNWECDMPYVVGKHITYLELLSVMLALKRWGHLWRGFHIRVQSDNMATVAAINKGTSKSKEMMTLVREMFWLCVQFDCRITASHIAGDLNVLSDRLSRLCEPMAALEALELLYILCAGPVFAMFHMSFASFVHLQNSWGRNLSCC